MFSTHVSLKGFSNYKIGGTAAYFFSPKSVEELIAGLGEWQKFSNNPPDLRNKIFILAGGTNLLLWDGEYSGLVLKPDFNFVQREGNDLVAGAGIPMADLLIFAEKESLSGLEWAGGLPGTLGGAVRGNAGCFGGEIKDSVREVTSVDYSVYPAVTIARTKEECAFRYRSSTYKEKGGEVITEVRLMLTPGEGNAIRSATEEKINYRKERHPLEYPNIGSIFKNVPLEEMMAAQHMTAEEIRKNFLVKDDPFPVVPTARLIGEAGLKGKTIGGAMVSPKHANFIVNTGNASADDVKKLIEEIKEAVQIKFGIALEEEVIIL